MPKARTFDPDMWQYVLKRIFIFLPTLGLITLLSFIISRSAPGDPVERMLGNIGEQGSQRVEKKASEAQYLALRSELGLDLPVFYFSLSTWAEPDTLHRLPKPGDIQACRRLTHTTGNWAAVERWHLAVRRLDYQLSTFEPDSLTYQPTIEYRSWVQTLRSESNLGSLEKRLGFIDSLHRVYPQSYAALIPAFNQAKADFQYLTQNPAYWKTYLPALHLYGFENQYHRWLVKLLQFDFGISYGDKRPIADKIWEAIGWTFLISFISILLTYLISIPIGIYSARNQYTVKDNIITTVLFMLYSLPSFWVATILILLLCGGDYLAWFPSNGVQDTLHDETWPLSQRLADWAWHLVLPIFCFTYTALAFLSRQMRVGMLETLNQDYIRTARAKGLSENVVVWKHALRNSLIPIITQFSGIFPAMVGGSVILETIFSLPGMGFLSFNAVVLRDYPTIVAVFTLSGFLTLVGILVADILYAVVDPRISFSRK
jgi:peptide/nickel transport system permease protein